jgi:autotransporter-associated beta strand protein
MTWNTSGTNKWTITGGNRTVSVNTAAGGYGVTINQVIGQETAGRGLIKSGNGTLTLSGVNTYSGDTTINGGTLSISNGYLANGANVYLSSGSTFNLNFFTTDTIGSLFIDGVSQATGSWGSLFSTASHITSLLTGPGVLLVSTYVSLPGDFNNNGKVDAADYVSCRKNFGSMSALPNDNGLGTPIGPSHYDLWRANFGTSASGSASGFQANPVPEPGAYTLVIIEFLATASRRGLHSRLPGHAHRRRHVELRQHSIPRHVGRIYRMH